MVVIIVCKKIIALLAAFVICISAMPVCYADSDGEYISKTSSYWDRALHGLVNGTSDVFLLSSGIKGVASFLNSDICALSSDGYHYADSLTSDTYHQGKKGASYGEAICKYCGEPFLCYASDLSTAYTDYVQTLPSTGYNSAGQLCWRIPSRSVAYYGSTTKYSESVGPEFSCSFSFTSLSTYFRVCFDDFVAPVTGDYTFYCYYFSPNEAISLTNVLYFGKNLGENVPQNGVFTKLFTVPFGAGDYIFRFETASYQRESSFRFEPNLLNSVVGVSGYLELVCTPLNLPDTYSTTTRPTSITGGNYGIVGDNNEITKVEDNSTIINETNNTYYNPATGTTAPIVDWSYDYSDRSYKVTLENGDTATVTYGDENISITENTTVSGDTVTNNYTIYYLVDGSGEAPADCPHDWQKSDATVPTCTLPGTLTYTCSLCSQTKTETIPALGHNWQVKQTVTTQYDDTGQLTQQGYTIFECSTCHEQYKSEDGALPPGGGSGTDPGGDEGETIWDKLAHLIGAIGNGIISVIEGVLGKLLDALIALAEMLVEKLKTVVDAVLKIFDEIPKLFGGFLDFLAALFPFLPAELMTILTFGVIAVVFIGIIKAVRR